MEYFWLHLCKDKELPPFGAVFPEFAKYTGGRPCLPDTYAPTRGVINTALGLLGITGPDWLGNVKLALVSVVLVDVWKGVGIATVIYIAGIASIPAQYYEALLVDGGNAFDKFRYITLPLVRPARNSVIILSFIGGLRTFDLIMVMTKGGSGFTTYTMSYVIYKLYTNSLYGAFNCG